MSNIERGIEIPWFWVQIDDPLPDHVRKRVELNASENISEEPRKDLLWSKDAGMSLDVEEMYYENGKIEVSASTSGLHLNLSIPVTKGMVIDIVEAYMKKLGQLKTLMELANKIDKEND